MLLTIDWNTLITGLIGACTTAVPLLFVYLQKRTELANERAKTDAVNQETVAVREQSAADRAADMLLRRVDALEIHNEDLQNRVVDLTQKNGQLEGSVRTLTEQQTNTVNNTTIIIGRLQERVRQNTEQIKAYQSYLDDLINSLDKEDGETKSRILARVQAHPPVRGKVGDTQRLELPGTEEPHA